MLVCDCPLQEVASPFPNAGMPLISTPTVKVVGTVTGDVAAEDVFGKHVGAVSRGMEYKIRGRRVAIGIFPIARSEAGGVADP